METFLSLFISGIMVGAIYGLIATGFVVLFKSSGILNLAQGEFVILGAYIFWTSVAFFGLPLWLSFILTFLVAVILGMLIERIAMRPLIGQSLLAIIMMTIVLSAGLKGIAVLFWAGEIAGLSIFPLEPVNIVGVPISQNMLWSFGLAMLGVIGFWLYFQYTRQGLAMRAVAEDHQASRSAGVRIESVFAISWIVAALVGGLGGILLATTAGVGLHLGALGLKVLPVVILGGLESIPGAIVAGLIIGVVENLAVGYLDPIIVNWGMVAGGLKEVVPFMVMLLILMIKPHGLFGLTRIERI